MTTGTERPSPGRHGNAKRNVSYRVEISHIWDILVITLAVIGTGLVIFAAARNTITWHLQRFWGASGDFWQSKWEKIHDWFEGDALNMAVWGTLLTLSISFWSVNFFFLFLDWRGRPETLLKYKIQMDKNKPVDTYKLINTIIMVMFNLYILGIPLLFIMYYMFSWRGCDFGRELPTFNQVLVEFVIISLTEEIGFYYTHRLAHWPVLYKHIHRRHHEWTAPISMAAFYSHPLEHVISNIMPVGLGPFLCGSHIATIWLWYSIALIVATITHSGYHLPLLPSSEFHDFHHFKFNYCYGVFGILDRLHGTDSYFRKMSQYDRHQVLLGFTPMSEQYPDNEKDSCKKN